jgi:hypothetical protein
MSTSNKNNKKAAGEKKTAGKKQSAGTAYDSLSIRERKYIQALTDVDSDTYDNQTQSYMRAYPTASKATAQVNGSRALSRTRVRNAVDELLDAQDLSRGAMLTPLVSIIRGTYRSTTETTDEGGNVVKTEHRSPRPAEVIKAIDVASRLRGMQAEASALQRVAEEEMIELYKKVERDVTESAQ